MQTENGQRLELCSTALQQLIAEFNQKPDGEGLNDIGAVAEILVLAIDNKTASGLIEQLGSAALLWLKSGLLEEIFYTHMDYGYHLSILCHLASRADGFANEDLTVIKTLIDNGMLLRGEVPVLTQYIITHHLVAAGITIDKPSFAQRDLSKMINKRVLRRRTDEHDVMVLTMIAQARKNHGKELAGDFTLFTRVLLSQAIRSMDHNRTALLLFIYPFLSPLPQWLKTSGINRLIQSNINCANFPSPINNQIDNDYVKRAKRGLRLRSLFCYTFVLSQGITNDRL